MNMSGVTAEILAGRNYYLYRDGLLVDPQPIIVELADLDLDIDEDEEDEEVEEDEEDEEETSDLESLLPEVCWVKRLSMMVDGTEAYYLIAIPVIEMGVYGEPTVLVEVVQRMGGGMFWLPGMDMPSYKSYGTLDEDEYSDAIQEELLFLSQGRSIKKGFSFYGKRLPQAMVDAGGNGGSNTDYTYALQSAFRLAYMHMSVGTDENGVIESFDYSTYQSSGSAYGDMFSRPFRYSDRTDEAIDMLLYILDKYSNKELEQMGWTIPDTNDQSKNGVSGGNIDSSNETTKVSETEDKEVHWRQNGKVSCRDWAERICRENGCGVEHEECPIMLQYEATHIVTRQPGEAAKLYEKSLSIAPDYGRSWDGLASAYQFMNNLDKAFEAQKKACELSPSCLTYGSMVRISYLSGRFDEARSYLEVYKQYDREGYLIEKKRLEEAEASNKKSEKSEQD